MSSSSLELVGSLKGHTGWVTQLATASEKPDMLVSASRDKSLIVWKLNQERGHDAEDVIAVSGNPVRALLGHGHFVSDVSLSIDGRFALSGSWDKSIRLWDVTTGKTARRFVSHTKDVLSVSFSPDNRQIVSGSRDRTIKLWNTLAQCKHTIVNDCHDDWVSCVRFSPYEKNPSIVSAGWDRTVKVWDPTNCRLKVNHKGHNGYVSTVAISPDGLLSASAGKDGNTMVWDLENGRHFCTLPGQDLINAVTFTPTRYWVCVAVGPSIKIWDLDTTKVIDELKVEDASFGQQSIHIECVSLTWSADGKLLFAGYTDNIIRVWQLKK